MKKIIILLYALISVELIFAQKEKTALDDWLQNNATELGGRVVLLVYKDGKIIYENKVNTITYKQKRLAKFIETRKGTTIDMEDLDANSKIAIASCSKWYTAALAMTFVEDKNLSLEDSIGKFLPIMTANGKGAIKIWHCLSHLTGIRSPGIKEDIKEFRDFKTMQDAMQYIGTLPMEGEPGKTFRYSNIGLQIIAAILEFITRKDFNTIFAERIAKPLDMQNTDWGDGEVALAAGGARSTAKDYMQFLSMILQKGKFGNTRILSEKSITAMQIDRVIKTVDRKYAPAEAGNWGYGFGEWVIKSSSEDSISQWVSSPGLFGTFPWVDNKNNYCAILLTMTVKNKGRNERYMGLKKLVDAFTKAK